MKLMIISAAALLLAACATSYEEQEVEAVRDYVAAAELEEVDEIRYFSRMSHRYVNDFFVTVDTRREQFLVEFNRRCLDLKRSDFTPQMADIRRDNDVLRARFDTIRGCRIGRIYKITDLQLIEVHDLGDAPGEEVYLPDDEQPK